MSDPSKHQTPAEMQAVLFQMFVSATAENMFELFRNPVHAWFGYREARKHRVPVPEWFLRYLDESAERILASPGVADSQKGIAEAFGFPKGAGTKARKQREYKTVVDLFRSGRARKPYATDGEIADDVAEEAAERLKMTFTSERVLTLFYKFTDARAEHKARPKTTRPGRKARKSRR